MFTNKPVLMSYQFVWNNTIYDLNYPDDKFAIQYEILRCILTNWLESEVLVIRTNPQLPTNSQLIVQLGVHMQTKDIASEMMREYFRKISHTGDNPVFYRFLNMMSIIYTSCDPQFIDVLRMRFYRSFTDVDMYGPLYDEEGPLPLPTKDDWIMCEKCHPWIWIIPHIQIVFAGNKSAQSMMTSSYQQQSRL